MKNPINVTTFEGKNYYSDNNNQHYYLLSWLFGDAKMMEVVITLMNDNYK
jgi:hypothetical protein